MARIQLISIQPCGAPPDRTFTVSVLVVATGQVAQLGYHQSQLQNLSPVERRAFILADIRDNLFPRQPDASQFANLTIGEAIDV